MELDDALLVDLDARSATTSEPVAMTMFSAFNTLGSPPSSGVTSTASAAVMRAEPSTCSTLFFLNRKATP